MFLRSFFLYLLVATSLILAGCEDPDADSVSQGTLGSCPGATVGEMAEKFMSSPTWESLTADDGKKYVNLSGGISFHDKPVNAKIQFKLNENDTFEFNAFEVNGVPQITLIANALLAKMCEATKN
ncbi:MAG: hypothetical protein VYA17_09940 [Pseudomonadota bacterium]|nr:hypothetical protein [Pseudomonadota bacterium]